MTIPSWNHVFSRVQARRKKMWKRRVLAPVRNTGRSEAGTEAGTKEEEEAGAGAEEEEEVGIETIPVIAKIAKHREQANAQAQAMRRFLSLHPGKRAAASGLINRESSSSRRRRRNRNRNRNTRTKGKRKLARNPRNPEPRKVIVVAAPAVAVAVAVAAVAAVVAGKKRTKRQSRSTQMHT